MKKNESSFEAGWNLKSPNKRITAIQLIFTLISVAWTSQAKNGYIENSFLKKSSSGPDPIKNTSLEFYSLLEYWPIRLAKIGHVTDLIGQLQRGVKYYAGI